MTPEQKVTEVSRGSDVNGSTRNLHLMLLLNTLIRVSLAYRLGDHTTISEI